MKLFLFLCFLFPVAWSQENKASSVECQNGLMTLLPLFSMQEDALKVMCAPGKQEEKFVEVRAVLKTCGLDPGSNTTSPATPMIQAIFGFVEKMFCAKKKGVLCYPHANKLFNVGTLMVMLT